MHTDHQVFHHSSCEYTLHLLTVQSLHIYSSQQDTHIQTVSQAGFCQWLPTNYSKTEKITKSFQHSDHCLTTNFTVSFSHVRIAVFCSLLHRQRLDLSSKLPGSGIRVYPGGQLLTVIIDLLCACSYIRYIKQYKLCSFAISLSRRKL